MPHDLKPDEIEVAKALSVIRQNYTFKRTQLTKALGRDPTSEEMYEVAREDIKLLHDLHELAKYGKFRPLSVIPVSLLVQTFLTKLLPDGILSSSTEEIAHDQPE